VIREELEPHDQRDEHEQRGGLERDALAGEQPE
jgi:hypothetical protein